MNIQTTLIVPKDEPLKQDIVFADGTITLSARLAEDSDTLSRLVLNWDIFGVGKKTRENKLTSEAGANVSFTLPSGTYYGNVTHRDLQVPFTTEILGGEIREQTVTLNAGYLRVKTSVEKGIVSVKAYRINGEKETLTGSEATTPRGSWFLLPEGTYRIIGTFRGKRAEKRVTLKPGDDQSITLTLPTP